MKLESSEEFTSMIEDVAGVEAGADEVDAIGFVEEEDFLESRICLSLFA